MQRCQPTWEQVHEWQILGKWTRQGILWVRHDTGMDRTAYFSSLYPNTWHSILSLTGRNHNGYSVNTQQDCVRPDDFECSAELRIPLPPSEITVAELLQHAGYRTAYCWQVALGRPAVYWEWSLWVVSLTFPSLLQSNDLYLMNTSLITWPDFRSIVTSYKMSWHYWYSSAVFHWITCCTTRGGSYTTSL